MRLEQMRYLSDIQYTHSISKTAKRFFVSQQSLSNNIKQLEAELEITLLERFASGVMLTEEAEALIALGDDFLQQYDELLAGFSQQAGDLAEMPASIRIYSSSIIATVFLPSAIGMFTKKYPKIKISVKEVTYKEIFPAILHNDCQLAFFSINEQYFLEQLKIYNDAMFKYHIILTDRLVGCVSSKSSLAKKEMIEQSDMATRFFTYLNIVPVDTGTIKQKGMPLYTTTNVDFHRRILRELDAISLMPSYAYVNSFDNKYFVSKPLEGAQQVVYHTVLYANSQPHPVLEEFVDTLTAFI